MPTSYTSLLGLALPVQGELQGTWGDEVNNYITTYLDSAVSGTQTISGSQTAVTLSKTTGTSLNQAGAGATGSSQYLIINCTGNPASTLTITAPAASKPYVVLNATSTSQNVVIVGAGPTTGVTVFPGEKILVAWNGSDFVRVEPKYRVVALADAASVTFNADTTDMATQANTQAVGTLTVNAPTGTPTNGQKLIFRLRSTNVQTFSWNAAFAGSTDLALPTASSGSTLYDYMGFIYNSTASKWQMTAKVFGF